MKVKPIISLIYFILILPQFGFSQFDTLFLEKKKLKTHLNKRIQFITPETKQHSFTIKDDSLNFLFDSIDHYNYIIITKNDKKYLEGELGYGQFNGKIKTYYSNGKVKQINTYQFEFQENKCVWEFGEPKLGKVQQFKRNGEPKSEDKITYHKCFSIIPIKIPETIQPFSSIDFCFEIGKITSDFNFIERNDPFEQSIPCYAYSNKRKIKISLANRSKYEIDPPSDGVFDTLATYYRLNIVRAYDDLTIPDSLINYFTSDSILHSFKNDIVTTDSVITIQCNGFKSMTIPLPPIQHKWDNHVIRVWLEPDLTPYSSHDETWDIIFNRKKGSNLLEVNGYYFEIVNFEN